MKTKTFSVTNAAFVAVTAQTITKEITIQEDASVVGFPTTNYKVAKPTSGDTPLEKIAGSRYVFRKGTYPYRAGDIAGYVKTLTGTTTFYQDETGD